METQYHKWDTPKLNQATCLNYGTVRKKGTVKVLMAIDRGRDVYKYKSEWKFTSVNGKQFIDRPECPKVQLMK